MFLYQNFLFREEIHEKEAERGMLIDSWHEPTFVHSLR